MGILLAAGDRGLCFFQRHWRKIPCPLPCPSMLARDLHRMAVLDAASRTLWTGQRIIPVDSGVERVLFWRDCLLTLSGDTDCLSLIGAAAGTLILTTPAGIYPQDMCLLPGGELLAVCGGADGLLRLMRLPELVTQQTFSLPGSVQRVACAAGQLYVLCAQEDEGLRCLLCRISLQNSRVQVLASWPGLPGAIHADHTGRLWVAASEMLCSFAPGSQTPEYVQGDFGLIRHMDSRQEMLLVSDPVLDVLQLVQDGRAALLKSDHVQHGLLT